MKKTILTMMVIMVFMGAIGTNVFMSFQINKLNNVIERYSIDEFDATEAIQDAEDSCFCTIEYIK